MAAIAALMIISVAYAHLCNNIYRTPARFIIKPEKPVTSVDKSEEIRVFVQNNFPVTVNKVMLTATSDDMVQTEVEPAVIDAMRPGARTTFTVKVTVPDKAPPKRHKLSIGISAMQIGFEAMDQSPVPRLRAIVASPLANPCTRILAAEALAKQGDPVGFQFLRDAALRSTQDFRSRAIRALGRVGHKSTISLLRELAREKDGYVKGNAILALGLAGAPGISFENALAANDKFVKTCAQAALTFQGSKEHLNELKEAMSYEDEFVQVAAAWGLASTGEKEGIDLLDKALSASSKEIKLRMLAGEALISLPDRVTNSKSEQ
jgi:hypothetical protein